MQPIINYIKHPASFLDSLVHNFGQWLPDSTYIKLRYRFLMGKKLNLKEPQTFQEKLQWLKLYDHNPLYTTLVDKILVKDYVASKVGEKYVIPLLAVWDKPEDIEATCMGLAGDDVPSQQLALDEVVRKFIKS